MKSMDYFLGGVLAGVLILILCVVLIFSCSDREAARELNCYPVKQEYVCAHIEGESK